MGNRYFFSLLVSPLDLPLVIEVANVDSTDADADSSMKSANKC